MEPHLKIKYKKNKNVQSSGSATSQLPVDICGSLGHLRYYMDVMDVLNAGFGLANFRMDE